MKKLSKEQIEGITKAAITIVTAAGLIATSMCSTSCMMKRAVSVKADSVYFKSLNMDYKYNHNIETK